MLHTKKNRARAEDECGAALAATVNDGPLLIGRTGHCEPLAVEVDVPVARRRVGPGMHDDAAAVGRGRDAVLDRRARAADGAATAA